MSMSQKVRLELKSVLSDKNNAFLLFANVLMSGVLISLLIPHSSSPFPQKPQVLAAQISPTPSTEHQHLSPTQTPSPIPTAKPSSTPIPTVKMTQTAVQPSPTSRPTQVPQPTANPTSTPTPQVQTQPSNSMATQILDALNTYRQKKGVASLAWDNTLGNFAQSRANTFASQGGMDGHAGFNAMLNNNGFAQLGFNALGENSSWGDFHNSGTYLIETMYAGDAPHDQNQLNPQWTHVGIGVNGQATDLVFGGSDRTK